MQILAGDIGGTHTRLVAARMVDDQPDIFAEKIYLSAEHGGLIQLIEIFLAEHNIAGGIAAACFAIAGPVESGVAAVTNLPWVISETDLSQCLKTPQVKLINDFAAAAYGILQLADADTLVLHRGRGGDGVGTHPDAAVIGAGTGLGASHLVWLNDRYQVFPSESGHTGFAPENAEQGALLAWLQTAHAHVSLEMLLSGRGLATIYRFLHVVQGLPEAAAVHQAMQKNDPAQVIAEHALAGSDELCRRTLEIFIDIYGAAAGNVALQYYPVSTLYIAGGIAPKIQGRMLEQRFMAAFVNKGVMTANMEKITVKLVTEDRVGLYGALALARQQCTPLAGVI